MGQSRKRASDSGRFALLLILLGVLLVGIAARLVYVQVVEAPVYAAKATAQRQRDIQIPPLRGTIYDRDGEPLAESVAAKTVYADPKLEGHGRHGRCARGGPRRVTQAVPVQA